MPHELTGDERTLIDGLLELDSTEGGFSKILLALDGLFEFPKQAVLLWSGCKRQSSEYAYPVGLTAKWKLQGKGIGPLDRRMNNGPPNSAFRLGGGVKSRGSELDHIYDGQPLWAVRDGLHFTQSAGLVAMHPHAHRQRHSNFNFSWLLRFIAYRNTGYDPLHVFSKQGHDSLGFVVGRSCVVFWPEPGAR